MPDFVTSILTVTFLLNSSMADMNTEFHYWVGVVLELEGGYVDNPADPGGATKYGISQRAYPHLDIYNLTRAEAIEIYRNDYWNPVAERVADPRMRILVADSAVNHGLGRALSWLETYNDFNSYLANRIRFYVGLNTFKDFGRGWMRRVAKIVEVSNRVQAENQFVAQLVDDRPFWVRALHALVGRSYNVKYVVRPSADGLGVELHVSELA
jgi:lysozyme family protein